MASVDSKKEKNVTASSTTKLGAASAKKVAETAVQAKKENVADTKKTTEASKSVETKKEVKAAPAAKKEVKKNTAKKATAKKAAAKKPVEKVEEVYFEYNGQQFLSKDIVEKVKEKYKAEGHRVGAIKTLRIYVNPDEHKAYYVINDKAEGDYVEI